MKKVVSKLKDLKDKSGNVHRKIYSKSKLPFFTLAFTLSALILTVVAVQQQQNLIQNAAQNEECPTGTPRNNRGNNNNGNDNGNGNNNNSATGRPDRNATQAARESTRTAREATRAARQGTDGRSVTNTVTNEPQVTITSSTTTQAPTISVGGHVVNSGSLRQNPNANKKISGQFIVKYKKDKPRKTPEEKIAKRNGRIKKRLARLQMDVVQVPTNQEAVTIGELRSDPNVENVYNDYYAFGGYTPNDTEFNKLYGMQKIEAPAAWDVIKGKNSVKIAILDTGIDKSHPDLAQKVVAEKNFLDNGAATDNHGHGTHVAGTAAAIGNNSQGVIGACPECSLLNGKVLDGNMSGPVSGIIEGINWAVENDADVISMSLGVAQDRSMLTPLEDAVKDAASKGVVIIALAGNCGDDNFQANHCDSKNKTMYPGAYDEVIAVGATDQNDKRASFSTTGAYVDVSAPGVGILSTWPGGGYKELSGTSQATPHVAGLAGLLIAQGKTAGEVKNQILSTADNVADSGSDKGRINAAKAVGGNTANPTSTTNPNNPDDPKPCHSGGTKKPDNDKKKDKKNEKKNEKKDNKKKNGGGDYRDRACRIFPNLPFCKGKNDDCDTNPPRNNNNNQNNTSPGSGSGQNGQQNSSNNSSTPNIGDINNDGTSNTRITINGQEIPASGQGGTAQDINTGGQQGGNHQTNINIDGNGQNQTSDQSGSNGNTQTNTNRGTGNSTSNKPCNNQGGNNNKDNDKKKKNDKKDNKKNDKKDDKDKKNNGGNGGNPICRIASWLGMCKNNNNGNNNNNNNNNGNNKNGNNNNNDGNKRCTKNSDCNGDRVCKGGKCERKNVKGASTSTIDPSSARNMLDYGIFYACLAKEKSCTPELKEASDRNNDDIVNRRDYEILLEDLKRE